MKLSAWAWAIPIVGLATAASLGLAGKADAARLENPVAEFAGIDKITGRITTFDVYVNETVQFGALQVTPKICYSRDDTEAQKIDAFIEVDEITLDRKIRRIFSGWMFADSPALNAVEHPIYDVWLTGCKANSEVPAPPGVEAVAKPAPEPNKPASAATPAPTAASVPPGTTVTDPSQATIPGADPNQVAVPPLDAPVEVPNEVIGGTVPQDEFLQDGQAFPQDGQPYPQEGQPFPQDGGFPQDEPLQPQPSPAPPGGVGLY
ncbi:DUF2155 domain-containing protein [Rhizobium sp. WL3]|nr:DUF2155 domain-containing protein [Rhizobium sp. WL3]